MTFQEGGSFGGGRVRSSRSGAGRGVAIGGGVGGLGLLVVLAITLLSGGDVDPGALLGDQRAPGDDGTIGACTAEQANTDRACRLSATLDSLDAYWGPTLEQHRADIPDAVEFESSVSTACGAASAAAGPFYCPGDQTIYLDLSFFDELTSRFGARGGPLAEMYVYAHEYGHHVQNVTGIFGSSDRGGTGAESDSVRVELVARHARVRDEHLDGAELGLDRGERGVDRGRVTYVADDAEDALGQVAGAVDRRDLVPGGDEPLGDRATDPPVRARDEDDAGLRAGAVGSVRHGSRR